MELNRFLPSFYYQKIVQSAQITYCRTLEFGRLRLKSLQAIRVKICVLALMIERIAERTCNQPWGKIHYALEVLQVTKFFNLNHRMHIRNEITADTRNM
jgi:hypothetical protein